MPKKKESEHLPTCSYDLCKQSSGLKECRYCHEFFCKNHIHAKVPSLDDMPEMTAKEKKVWDKPGGHLCDAYKDFLQDVKKEVDEDNDKEVFKKKDSKDKKSPHHEERCTHCLREIPIKYACENCGLYFCYEHRLPQKHNCKEMKTVHGLKKPKVHTGPIKTVIGLLALLFIMTLVYFTLTPDAFVQEVVTEEWESFTDSVPLNISFSEYTDNLSFFLGKTIEVKGFLFRSGSGSNVALIKNYLVDEEGNAIELVVIDAAYRALLPSDGRSDDVYLVSGLLEENIVGDIRLIVRTMVQSERDVQEFPSKRLVTHTTTIEKEGPLIDVFKTFTNNIREIFY